VRVVGRQLLDHGLRQWTNYQNGSSHQIWNEIEISIIFFPLKKVWFLNIAVLKTKFVWWWPVSYFKAINIRISVCVLISSFCNSYDAFFESPIIISVWDQNDETYSPAFEVVWTLM
jgi:hypothetical protein